MKVSNVNLEPDEIENIIQNFNDNFIETITKINIFTRVFKQSTEDSEHTLI